MRTQIAIPNPMEPLLFGELEEKFTKALRASPIDKGNFARILDQSTSNGPWEGPAPKGKVRPVTFYDGQPREREPDGCFNYSAATNWQNIRVHTPVKTERDEFTFVDVLKLGTIRRGQYGSYFTFSSVKFNCNIGVNIAHAQTVFETSVNGWVGGVWAFHRRGSPWDIKPIELFKVAL